MRTSIKYGAGLLTRFMLEHAASTVLSKKEFVPKGYLAYMEDKHCKFKQFSDFKAWCQLLTCLPTSQTKILILGG